MLKITDAPGGITITWTRKTDDPQGWLMRAYQDGHLADALSALGDPMMFAQVAADDEGAREQLRSVAWMLRLLERRRDALVVALRDRGAASWTDLVRTIDPEEPEPMRKRSAMQRLYEAGRRRAGLPTT